jgi:hypothetical protein
MDLAIPLFLRRDAVKRPSFKSAAPTSPADERQFRSLPQQPFSATFIRCLAVQMYFAERSSALD